MIDIQSPTAEIRRGKKEEREKIETAAAKYNGLPIAMGGHKETVCYHHVYYNFSQQ